MKRWGTLAAVLAVLAAGGAYFLLWGSGGEPITSTVPTMEVTKGPFTVTLDVEGNVRAVNSVMISAPSTRYSLQIVKLIEEGEVVKEGDMLVRFDSADLTRDLDRFAADLEKIDIQIVQKKNDMATELARLDRDLELTRLGRDRAALEVTDSDTVPDIVKKRNRLILKEAELHLAKLEEERKARETASKNQLQLLILERTKTLASLKEAETAKSRLEITAPKPGLVMYVEAWRGGKRAKPSEGDTVWRGHKLLELPDLAELEVLAWVHEVDVAAVAVDQIADVYLDAHPDARYMGKLTDVADLAMSRNRDSEVKEFEVVVALTEHDEKVRPGMTARVHIPVEELEDVLAIPLEAVSEKGDKPVVFRKSVTGPEAVTVELGQRNDSRVVIIDGLAAGEIIYLGDPTGSEGDGSGSDEEKSSPAVKEAKAAP